MIVQNTNIGIFIIVFIGFHIEFQGLFGVSRFNIEEAQGAVNQPAAAPLMHGFQHMNGLGQIAQLIFITVAKQAVSIEALGLMISVQKSTYETSVAYEYLRLELINMLEYVFGRKKEPEYVGVEHTEQKHLLKATITAVAHKMYLDKYVSALSEERSKEP